MNVVHGWRFGTFRLRRVRQWDLLSAGTWLKILVGDGIMDSRLLRWEFYGLDSCFFCLRPCIFGISNIISMNNPMKIYRVDLRRMQREMQYKLKLKISRNIRKSRTRNNFVLGLGKPTIIPVTLPPE